MAVQGSPLVILGGAAGIVAAGVAGFVLFQEPELDPGKMPDDDTAVTVPVETLNETPRVEPVESATPPPAALDGGVAETEMSVEAPAAPDAPSFDVVRVESDGEALIAGNALAFSVVSILLDGVKIAETEADSSGKFVSFLSIAPSQQPQVVSLNMVPGDGRATVSSIQTVILAPATLLADAGDVTMDDADAEMPETGLKTQTVDNDPSLDQSPVDEAPVEENIDVASTAPASVTPQNAEIDDATAETIASFAPNASELGSEPAAPSADLSENGALVADQDATLGETQEVLTDNTAQGAVTPAITLDITDDVADTFNAIAPPTQDDQNLDAKDVTGDAEAVETALQTAPTTLPDTDTALSDVPETQSAQVQVDEVEAPNLDADASVLAADSQAPAVLLADDQGIRVLQPQGGQEVSPEVMTNVALDSITYNAEGDVQLTGRGLRDGFVRIYLDNKPITTSRIQADGSWTVALPEVDTGVYTLRVDQVDDEGTVTSRIESPFKREAEDVVAAVQAQEAVRARAQGGNLVSLRTVQPGATLWAIARESYGEGVLFVKVFEANKDRIRDPDLIYPGQVFVVPN